MQLWVAASFVEFLSKRRLWTMAKRMSRTTPLGFSRTPRSDGGLSVNADATVSTEGDCLNGNEQANSCFRRILKKLPVGGSARGLLL